MRIFALVLLICSLPSCSVTWHRQGSGLSHSQRQGEIKSVAALAKDFETRAYFADLSRRRMGFNNAVGRDLRKLDVTIDRHFFNYSENDPYVNFKSDLTVADHLHRFVIDHTISPFLNYTPLTYTDDQAHGNVR